MDVLLYTGRAGCVTEVNEQRVRASTQGAQGTLASWRCSALQGPPLGVHGERDPEPPQLGSGSSLDSLWMHGHGQWPQRGLLEPSIKDGPLLAFLCPRLRGWLGSGLAVPGIDALHSTCLSSLTRLICAQSSCPGGRLLSPK